MCAYTFRGCQLRVRRQRAYGSTADGRCSIIYPSRERSRVERNFSSLPLPPSRVCFRRVEIRPAVSYATFFRPIERATFGLLYFPFFPACYAPISFVRGNVSREQSNLYTARIWRVLGRFSDIYISSLGYRSGEWMSTFNRSSFTFVRSDRLFRSTGTPVVIIIRKTARRTTRNITAIVVRAGKTVNEICPRNMIGRRRLRTRFG